jgi:hypothetical protein
VVASKESTFLLNGDIRALPFSPIASNKFVLASGNPTICYGVSIPDVTTVRHTNKEVGIP